MLCYILVLGDVCLLQSVFNAHCSFPEWVLVSGACAAMSTLKNGSVSGFRFWLFVVGGVRKMCCRFPTQHTNFRKMYLNLGTKSTTTPYNYVD